ncbi:MAG: 2-oxoglutarate dehydrogenase E1 component [Alphaproteobacteria bacterium]|nr:2-oxoglutarate dehydrogenase E1 component [Alphaproteobacteria bacterium]
MTRPIEQTSFLSGANAPFVAELYARFLENPANVDTSWSAFFGELGDDAHAALSDLAGASWAPRGTSVIGNGENESAPAITAEEPTVVTDATVRAATTDSIRALMMIRAYRVRGHLEADLDPLGIAERKPHPELDYRSYGFTDDDLDRNIFIDHVFGLDNPTLREIVAAVRETYCGNIGVEYMHIQEPDKKAWLEERFEAVHNRTNFTARGKRAILERLTEAEAFENFLDKKYTGTKRFGLDGGESLVPALEQIIKRGGELGVTEIVIGMPHRGRLNVLANMMGKPYQAIFSEFHGASANPEDVQGSGDVKYHLGTSSDREFGGTSVHLSLTANPSHLEAVDPVVIGKVRAKQTQRGKNGRKEIMGLLMHGDAAFAGQGLVAETLDLSALRGYRTGGTIHVVVNNQIGFTTNPVHSRSGPYCSEMAKIIQAPVLHVNGDDPEAVVHVSRIAAEYRQEFGSDVVIDMFCYRRFGHNEGDEPAFTQPLMYQAIADHPPTRRIYADKLIAEGLITAEKAEAMVAHIHAQLDADFEAASAYRPNKADWLEGAWTGLEAKRGEYIRGKTAVQLKTLRGIGHTLTEVPQGFEVNRKILRQLKAKRDNIEKGEGIDWATAEALAWGSLLVEGTPIRLSGQDCQRGTFSQRHAVWTDQKTQTPYTPLANLSGDQAMVELINSPLSEAAVLGFEYGYSLAEPHALVMWEAQFGDFANGAQIIIDQFIVSGESKWLRLSGLVMLLPHGFEGQGPEHSSARLERFLQLCGDDNIQVVNCTTPASYFHVLRRQVRRKYRKPLIIMTPKSLLRHKRAVSPLKEMGPGTSFHRVLWDENEVLSDAKITRVVLCSGKVYFDLAEARQSQGIKDTYVLRLEQISPFPDEALTDELGRFMNAKQIVWCQEEPQNMGGWTYVDRPIEAVLGNIGHQVKRPVYAGRPASASPATGLHRRHVTEQNALVKQALKGT